MRTQLCLIRGFISWMLGQLQNPLKFCPTKNSRYTVYSCTLCVWHTWNFCISAYMYIVYVYFHLISHSTKWFINHMFVTWLQMTSFCRLDSMYIHIHSHVFTNVVTSYHPFCCMYGLHISILIIFYKWHINHMFVTWHWMTCFYVHPYMFVF